MVPLSHATIASDESRRPSSLASTWGFIGNSVRVARLDMSSRQSFMRFCAVSRKPRSDLRLSRGRSAASVRGAVADQADLHRIPESDAHRIELDLDAARLSGLGQKLDVGERRADHQEGVALLERLLRGPRSE